MAYLNGVYLQIADHGRAYTSYDLDFWVPQATGTTNGLRGIAAYQDRFLIVGANGTVLIAAPATNLCGAYSLVDLGTTNWLESVALSPQWMIAVGDNGSIYRSSDGKSWQRALVNFTDWLRSVAYGNGRFVTVGENGFVASSSDGLQWQSRTRPTQSHLNRIVWINDRFWVVGNNGLMLHSATGTTWSSVVTQATNDLYAIAHLNTNLMLAGIGELRIGEQSASGSWTRWFNQLIASNAPPSWSYFTALDNGSSFLAAGKTGMLIEGLAGAAHGYYDWFPHSECVRSWLWDLTQAPGFFVAVGDLGTILSSQNGASWDREVVPTNALNSIFLGIGGDTNCLLAVGNRGALLISSNSPVPLIATNQTTAGILLQASMVSSLGVVWQGLPAPTTNDLQGVLRWNGAWFVTGGSGEILWSPDAVHWEKRNSHTRAFLSCICAYSNGLVTVGSEGSILTSPDGMQWQPVSVATTNWLYRVRALNGQLIAVGQGGTIAVCPDPQAEVQAWIVRATGVAGWLNDIACFAGNYLAVGTQGTVIASRDLVTWHRLDSITGKSLYTIATTSHQMLVAGTEGVILRAQTSPSELIEYARHGLTNRFTLSGIPGNSMTLDFSRDLKVWTSGEELQWLDNTGWLTYDSEDLPSVNQSFYKPVTLP